MNGKRKSKKTVAAIMAFQEMEGLPITGKVDPHGQCMNKLRDKTPPSARKAVMEASENLNSMTKSQEATKSKAMAIDSQIKTKEALPFAEARTLAQIARGMHSQYGVPLKLKSVTLNAQGRFQAMFEVSNDCLANTSQAAQFKKCLPSKFANMAGDVSSLKGAGWSATGHNLTLTSNRNFSYFVSSKAPSNFAKNLYGIGGTTLHPIAKSILAALEGYLPRTQGDKQKTAMTLAAEILKNPHPEIAKKIEKEIANGKAFKLGLAFQETRERKKLHGQTFLSVSLENSAHISLDPSILIVEISAFSVGSGITGSSTPKIKPKKLVKLIPKDTLRKAPKEALDSIPGSLKKAKFPNFKGNSVQLSFYNGTGQKIAFFNVHVGSAEEESTIYVRVPKGINDIVTGVAVRGGVPKLTGYVNAQVHGLTYIPSGKKILEAKP